jgi:hypothetical protein
MGGRINTEKITLTDRGFKMLMITIGIDDSRIERNGVLSIYPQGKDVNGIPVIKCQAEFFDVRNNDLPFLFVRAANAAESPEAIYGKFFPGQPNPFAESVAKNPGNQIAFPGTPKPANESPEPGGPDKAE